VWVKNDASAGDVYHNRECGSRTRHGGEGYSEEVAKARGFLACRKCRPSGLVFNVFPDYLSNMTTEDKLDFLKATKEWKPEFDKVIAAFVETKFPIEVRALTDEDIATVVESAHYVTRDYTFGRKWYFGLKEVGRQKKFKKLAAEIEVYGQSLLKVFNSPGSPTLARLRNKDLVLVNWGAHMEDCPKFEREEWEDQLGHWDIPATVKGVKCPYRTAIVSLTPRAETLICFDMGVEQLLEGKRWSQGTEADKKRMLWRLFYAHKRAFELQAARYEIAKRDGDRQSCEAGTVHAFYPDTTVHAGQAALESSTRPEVFILFQFARTELAEYADKHINAEDGFGQHIWDYNKADELLMRVERDTRQYDQVSLSISSSTAVEI
jgi:hypothetical protein